MDLDNLARAAWAQAWQLAILCTVVSIVAGLFARSRAHLAHTLWLLVLLKAVTPPLWSNSLGVFCRFGPSFATEAKATTNGSIVVLPVRARPAESADPFPESGTGDATVLRPAGEKKDAAAAVSNRNRGVAVAIWLTGVFAIAVVGVIRYRRCWRRIRGSQLRSIPDLDSVLSTLRLRLRVRPRVRLIVSESGMGPMVLGLWRPTVVLPARLVGGRSPRDLEAILAHELIHIRRGDLGVSLLQMLAQAAWWFHPAVWIAGRSLTRESERCCDEETIGELECDRLQYARGLLGVLEMKRFIKSAAALPGIHPAEVTAKRLERIMRLGQGCQKRTPGWCRIVLLLGLLLAAPGAQFAGTPPANGAELPTSPPQPSDVPAVFSDPTQGALLTERHETRAYKALDLLAKAKSEFHFNDEQAKTWLIGWIYYELALPRHQFGRFAYWKGEQLVVELPASLHGSLTVEFERARAYGFDEFAIELKTLEGPPDAIRELLNATLKTPLRSLFGGSKDPHGPKAQKSPEENPQLEMAVLDSSETSALISTAQRATRFSVTHAPKVTTMASQECVVDMSRPAAYIDIPQWTGGVQTSTLQPVNEGLSVQIVPTPASEESISLGLRVTCKDVENVKEITLQLKPTGKLAKVKIPLGMSTSRFNVSADLKPNQTAVLAGLKESKQGKHESIVILVSARKQIMGESDLRGSARP